MAEISVYSGDFRKAINELDALTANQALTSAAHDEVMNKYGFDPDEFLESYEEYEQLSDEEKQEGASLWGDLPYVGGVLEKLDPLARIGGRALGEAGRGVVEFGEDIFPETTQKAKDIVGAIADKTGQYIPESIQEYADQIFDPYHGDGIYGIGEETVGHIGSYFVPMLGIAKGYKVGKGALSLNKHLRAGINNLGKITGKPGAVSRYALTGATGVTMVEDPQENIINVLTEQFPESLEFLDRVAVDPNDSRAQQRLNAFLNNLGLEVGVFGGFGLLGQAWKRSKGLRGSVIDINVLGTKPLRTLVDKPFQYSKAWFTSKRGLRDDHMDDFVKRDVQAINASQRADVVARELKSLIKKYRLNPDDVTKALAGTDMAVQRGVKNAQANQLIRKQILTNPSGTIRRDLRDLLNEMNKNVGDLSSYLAKNDRVAKDLTVAINKNGDSYLTTSYRMFDDPKFKQSVRRAIENNMDPIKGAQRYKKDIIDPTTKKIIHKRGEYNVEFMKAKSELALRDATSFLLNDLKLSKDDAIAFLRSLTGDATFAVDNVAGKIKGAGAGKLTIDQFGESLIAMAGKASAGARSSKALLKKKKIPDPLKALMGEVKDPAENYLRTFEKLSVYKSEIEFLEKVAKDLVKAGHAKKITGPYAIKGSKGAGNLDLQDLTDVGSSRLSQIFGRTPTKKDAVKNPLHNLYADPLYKKALQEGLDGMIAQSEGTLNTMYSGYTHLKIGTQWAKTVGNPLTHGRNIFGNLIFMGANGFAPIGIGSGKDALVHSIAKLGGLNNRKLAETMSRYRELGITGSDVGVGTMKRNLQKLGQDPNTYYKNSFNWKEIYKKPFRKLTQVYQLEDDIFKIMHFEKTKDYLKKAFPNKNISEIEILAARRTRDLLPNYTITPRILKKVSRAPVGDFATFAAESLRVSKNLMKYTIQDALSGNAALTGMAARRMAGMTIAGLGGDYLHNKSQILMGITDEQSEALQNTGERWEFLSNQIYLSPIKKVHGHIVVDSMPIGTLSPFAFPQAIARTLHALANNEDISKGDIKGFLSSPESKKLLFALYDKTMSPFIGSSMATDAIFDAITALREGKTIEEMGGVGQVAMETIGYPLLPGGIDFWTKRNRWQEEQRTKDVADRNKGAPAYSLWSEAHKGFNMNIPSETDWWSFMGFKTRRQDISASVPFNIGYDLNSIRSRGSKEFKDILKEKITPLKRDFDPSIVEEDIWNAYINGEEQTLKREQQLKFMVDQYLTLGLDIKDIIEAMTIGRSSYPKGAFTNTLIDVLKNRHKAYKLKPTDIDNYRKFLERRGVDLDMEKYIELFNKFDNTKIDKDK